MVQKDRRTGTLHVEEERLGWLDRARQPAAIALSLAVFFALLCAQPCLIAVLYEPGTCMH